MKVAPPQPTTEQLHDAIPLTSEELDQVDLYRNNFIMGMEGTLPILAVAEGQCSTTGRDYQTTIAESRTTRGLTLDASHIMTIKRINNWKPRSDPDDWHGLETDDPELAYRLMVEAVREGAPVCTELAVTMHAARYSKALTMGWVGARNRNIEEIFSIAEQSDGMPLLVKNDLDGSPDWALNTVARLRTLGVTSYLLYRGGLDTANSRLWESEVRRLIDETGGKLMLDLAHGSEQAHDIEGKFGKSVDAQKRAMNHYLEIGSRTGMWAHGIMLEASDAPSETDPNMPHQVALEGIRSLATEMFNNRSMPAHW